MSTKNSTFTNGKCTCENPDKSNWEIVGYEGRYKDRYVIACSKCGHQWITKAKYVEKLNKACYLK
jgi:hypothetical protein